MPAGDAGLEQSVDPEAELKIASQGHVLERRIPLPAREDAADVAAAENVLLHAQYAEVLAGGEVGRSRLHRHQAEVGAADEAVGPDAAVDRYLLIADNADAP